MNQAFASFMQKMSALDVSVHGIALAILFVGCATAYFWAKQRELRVGIAAVSILIYIPFLVFYIVKPNVLTFMENKMKNGFVDVQFDERAGRKVIQ